MKKIIIPIIVILLTIATALSDTGGNIVYQTGDYAVHIFTANGTYTPSTARTVEVLIIGGGGGGGTNAGGGGGAGGFLFVNYSVNASGAVAVVVGMNGTGSASDNNIGNKGTNSSFSGGIVALGGCGGNSQDSAVAQVGCGSGGGGSWGGGAGGANVKYGGLGTNGQGFNGGNGTNFAGGGGGGAQSPGGNHTADGTPAGHGGWGLNNSINGTIICYAGGGGGSNGNTGGIGVGRCGGGDGTQGTAKGGHGTVYGSGGGGGSGADTTGRGGDGKTGVVIIRYLNVSAPAAALTPCNLANGQSYTISPGVSFKCP